MPEGTSSLLDHRSLEKDYPTLTALLRPGMRVLDVGCGTGAITRDIAAAVQPGAVTGIDSTAHLIIEGQQQAKEISNLQLIHADLFSYQPSEAFHLVVSARVLQWLDDPSSAILRMKQWLRPGGTLSILDYNHVALEWQPLPPTGMQEFYQAFLRWRADAGMDNEMAEHLPKHFKAVGLQQVEVLEAAEVSRKGEADFFSKLTIWSTVAATRGKQMVQDGYITEEARLKAIEAYKGWMSRDAAMMRMELKEVRGKNS